jgi:hypothetical protein
MMKISSLLNIRAGFLPEVGPTEVDPFSMEDGLQEAQVLDIRLDTLTGVAAILLELRLALHIRGSNTGLIVAHGVRELVWSAPARDTPLTAWSVGSSRCVRDEGILRMNLTMWPHPGAQLLLSAEAATFFVGDVPGLSESPPDYTEMSPGEGDGEIAGWESEFVVVGAVRAK